MQSELEKHSRNSRYCLSALLYPYQKDQLRKIVYYFLTIFLLVNSGLVYAESLWKNFNLTEIISFGSFIANYNLINTEQENLISTSEVHHFELDCDQCHNMIPSSSSELSNLIGPLKININSACTMSGCHQYDKNLNHPVGIRPSGNLPEDFPLDQNGRLTCLSCHDELNRWRNQMPETSSSVSNHAYLRWEGDRELCAGCHLNLAGTTMQKSHWQFSTLAHLYSSTTFDFENVNSSNPLDYIDTESRTCMECHDDKAVAIRYASVFSSRHREITASTDHPIGIIYEDITMHYPRGFRQSQSLPDRVRLFQGRVGCGSCHSLYSNSTNNLVDTFERGNLCRHCHNK